MRSAVYVTDTMADVRMVEGLSKRYALTVLAPASIEGRVTTWWPPRLAEGTRMVLLRGGRIAFIARAAWWLIRRRRTVDVAFVLDNITAALAANIAGLVGGPPPVLQVGRPTVEYYRCKSIEGSGSLRYRLGLLVVRALVSFNERLAAGVGTVSDYVADQVRRHDTNVKSIPFYGVETDVFAPRWTKQEARRMLGLPQDVPVVLYRSRLAPEKDPDTFLRSIAALRSSGREVLAVYMGGEYPVFAERAARLGVDVEPRDASSRAELPVWYVAADVCVQTSYAEGLGISLLESLACGVPVVVTDVGGLPEVVRSGLAGVLVPARDPAALAEAVGTILDDPDRAAEIGRRGRDWVIERYTADRAFSDWVELGEAARVARGRLRPWPVDRPLSVLFVDHEVRLSGGERDLVDLVRALDPNEVEVHVAVPTDGPLAEELERHGARIHLVPLSENLRRFSRWELARRPHRAAGELAAFAAGMIRLRKLIRRLRPDVVHTNSMKAHLLATVPALSSGVPLVWHVRDILQDGWLRRLFARLAGVFPARVICLSKVAGEQFAGTRAEPKVRVVYNGIRPEPVEAEEVSAWRLKLGAANGEVLVGIVGQVARWKGQDTFVEAAAAVAARFPDARFAIIGECLFPENESSYYETTMRRTTELGLDDRVVWAGWTDCIDPVMRALDVLVHASRLPEPFGRVMVEAMAAGTPVVASAVGAGPEIVTPASGILIPPDDVDALAEAVSGLLEAPGRRAAMGAAAVDVAASFDISQTGEGVLGVYRELLG